MQPFNSIDVSAAAAAFLANPTGTTLATAMAADTTAPIRSTGLSALKVVATPVAATGAGTGVATAAALGVANVVAISSDGATKGVKLLTGTAGNVVWIINTSATAANLFAASGGVINGGAADAGCAIPASKGVLCLCTAADTWYVFQLAALAGAAA